MYKEKIFVVYTSIMAKKEEKKLCDFCGGTGQLSFFHGVSRFLLTTEECDECAGTGFELETSGDDTGHQVQNNKTGREK